MRGVKDGHADVTESVLVALGGGRGGGENGGGKMVWGCAEGEPGDAVFVLFVKGRKRGCWKDIRFRIVELNPMRVASCLRSIGNQNSLLASRTIQELMIDWRWSDLFTRCTSQATLKHLPSRCSDSSLHTGCVSSPSIIKESKIHHTKRHRF